MFLEPYQLGDSEDEGEHRLLVDRYLGTLDIGLARDVEQLLATQPSELHALTAHLSGREARALFERALDDGQAERAQSAERLQAEVSVWDRREQELIEQLRVLLDGALEAVCELPDRAVSPPPADY